MADGSRWVGNLMLAGGLYSLAVARSFLPTACPGASLKLPQKANESGWDNYEALYGNLVRFYLIFPQLSPQRSDHQLAALLEAKSALIEIGSCTCTTFRAFWSLCGFPPLFSTYDVFWTCSASSFLVKVRGINIAETK
jgi:hypothetical protein